MIKNIIFDLGNVILPCANENTMKNFIQDKEEIQLLKQATHGSETWKLMDKGMIDTKQAIQQMQQSVPKRLEKIVETYMYHWFEYRELNKDTVAIATQLKEKGYHLYVLSNMAVPSYEHIKNHDFFKLCSGIVISGYEHVVKPEKEIFLRLVQRYDLIPEECLLIDDDDTSRSIVTANQIGIKGRRVEPNNSFDILKLLKEYQINI